MHQCHITLNLPTDPIERGKALPRSGRNLHIVEVCFPGRESFLRAAKKYLLYQDTWAAAGPNPATKMRPHSAPWPLAHRTLQMQPRVSEYAAPVNQNS